MSAGLARARPSKRTPGRPRGSNTDARRETIISAAVRLFAYRGYDAATLQEIADLVGVTRPAVHHYFPGKAPLYRAALNRAYDIVMVPVEAHPLARFTAPAHGELRLACALLGTSLAQSHRIAEIAPRITSVSADLRHLCQDAIGVEDEQRVTLLVAMIVGRWVLTASDLTWLDIETRSDPL
jgi:AcrR family transcriptional regulator